MEAWYQGLSLIQKVFAICAIVGGVVFLFRTVLVFTGFAHDMDLGDHVDVGLGDTDISFHFLTIHGITAFFLMFGIAGLSLSKMESVPSWGVLCGSAVAGLVTMWLIGKLFSVMGGLQSEGTLRMENAIGQEGVAYLNIAPGGIGKIQVTIQGGLKIFSARSDDTELIRTGDRVKVLSVTPDNTLIVEKIA